MLSSNMMPVMMPRPAPMFQQSPFPLGMYPSHGIMFHPSQLFPPPPSRDAFSANPLKSGYLPSSPPLKPQALMSSPNFYAHSSGSPSPPMMMKSPSSSSCTRGSPSPPCSPDSASSSSAGGEKTVFTIDAILSSNKRSPSSSSQSGSSRSGYGSDRRLTPSPDSYNFVSPKSTSPSKIWNAPRFQAADFRYGADGVKKTSEYHFDSHCDSKLSSTMSATSEERLNSMAADSVRNVNVTKDKSLKRLRCDENEWNPRAKRVRTIFTQEQLERLEKEFDRQQYMVGSERLYLAAELSLSESQVKVWFQNRRIKWRKQNFEKQQIQLAHIRTVHDNRYDGEHSSEEDDELLNDHVSPSSSTMPRDDTHNRIGSGILENSDATTSSTTTHPSIAQGSGHELSHQRETSNGASLTSPNAASAAVSFSAALQLEVKKVEERLAMRLCRRNMVQASSTLPSSSSSSSPSSSSSSSSATLSSASHLRLMSSIRRMESSHDIEYQKRD